MSDTRKPNPAPSSPEDEAVLKARLSEFRGVFNAVEEELSRTIVGQQEVVRLAVSAIFLGGHVLLEGVPGLGKTVLMNALGASLGIKVTRVQFTPDLMPADITGTRVLVQDEGGAMRFEFERGPVFTPLLLADEINRATPKTQSALLEAMQERTVTVAGTTHKLPSPFLVLATQNPLESEGTYPLPDAQLDRFLFKVIVRFPTQLELIEIARRSTTRSMHVPKKVLDSAEEITAMQRLVQRVPTPTPTIEFAARLVLATHPAGDGSSAAASKWVRYGASPRGLQALLMSAKLRAVLDGRFAAGRDDVREVAKPCLRHRIGLNFQAESEGIDADNLITQILQKL